MRRSHSLFDLAGHLARLGAYLMLATTVAATLIPGSNLPQDLPPDLLLHVTGFGAPAFLAAFGARSTRENAGCVALIATVAFATEIAQALVPGRDFSVLDLVANAVGIGLGATLGSLIHFSLLRRFGAAPPGQS